ncbi:MAG TPA: M23 family metallopeptidase [Gaiellaceae bacterium]|nr:M23 family metallopeptidase [Gaiellaceae bacterium]
MATTRTISTLAGFAAAVALVAWPAPRTAVLSATSQLHEGFAPADARRQEPDAIEAAFPLESYRPGSLATLRLWTRVAGTTVSIHRVGPERQLTVGDKTMEGVVMAAARPVFGRSPRIAIGRDWPSGLYFARLEARGKVGFAPFVVRPRRLGEHRVAVVLPTRTWQAYNFRDDDGDGDSDSWYATQGSTAALGRPYLNRGVPPHFRKYDLRFLRWLHQTGRGGDVLSQAELDSATGGGLFRAYDLLVFPGHHEYVTEREYDAVEGFRDRGGNLMFLSANNFFWKIELRGRTMTRVKKWRELGRPEAALLGVQYIGNDEGERRGPWLVRPAAARGWVFAGVKLGRANAFSNAGIEIDAVAPSSPPGTQIVAEIPNLLGRGMTAHMTYYERRGAKVFSAGAFTLAGSIRQRPVQTLIKNLWTRLTNEPRPRPRRLSGATTGRYGWPVRPFHTQHPVRGYFGDPRIGMTPEGMRRSFHFGVDISAPDGAPVYATISGTVHRWSHRPETVAVRADDGLTSFEYWHIRPAVSAGQRVTAYRTVVGHIEAGWGHVHFSELRRGIYLNPLRPGALSPYGDTTKPLVKSLRAERNDTGMDRERLHGKIDLVVEVADRTPIAVPAPWAGRPVTPAVVRWRVLGHEWRTAIDFRRGIPHHDAFHIVYAPRTRQNKPWRNGRYRFYLTRGWPTTALPNGTYRIDVAATDTRGNTTVESFDIGIRNEGDDA